MDILDHPIMLIPIEIKLRPYYNVDSIRTINSVTMLPHRHNNYCKYLSIPSRYYVLRDD